MKKRSSAVCLILLAVLLSVREGYALDCKEGFSRIEFNSLSADVGVMACVAKQLFGGMQRVDWAMTNHTADKLNVTCQKTYYFSCGKSETRPVDVNIKPSSTGSGSNFSGEFDLNDNPDVKSFCGAGGYISRIEVTGFKVRNLSQEERQKAEERRRQEAAQNQKEQQERQRQQTQQTKTSEAKQGKEKPKLAEKTGEDKKKPAGSAQGNAKRGQTRSTGASGKNFEKVYTCVSDFNQYLDPQQHEKTFRIKRENSRITLLSESIGRYRTGDRETRKTECSTDVSNIDSIKPVWEDGLFWYVSFKFRTPVTGRMIYDHTYLSQHSDEQRPFNGIWAACVKSPYENNSGVEAISRELISALK